MKFYKEEFMSNIFVYSASSKIAQIHYNDTIKNGISLEKVLGYITDSVFANTLKDEYSNDGLVYLWAGKSPAVNTQKSRGDLAYWELMQPGDLALAYRNYSIVAASYIVAKIKDKYMGDYCWDNHDRSYDLIYFLSKPLFVNKKVANIKDSNDISYFGKMYQGLRRLSRSKDIIRDFGSINKFAEDTFGLKSFDSLEHLDLFDEIEKYKGDFSDLDKTERDAIIKSRIGQGRFRENLKDLWKSCSVKGLNNHKLLRASHIKPWKSSNNSERLDRYNGLLLIPNLDLLFDCGLISFYDNGKIILSNKLSDRDRELLAITNNLSLRKVFPENLKYLKYHRENVFKSELKGSDTFSGTFSAR